MVEVNLLRSLPTSKRNLKERETAKSEEHIRISREYGLEYFDGPREYGYGGYRYDGRWKPVARDIIDHFNLKEGDRVLDIGCAKGFLVKDLLDLGIDAYGVDVSKYALENCMPETIGRLHLCSASDICFPKNSFAAVLSINTLHNLDKGLIKKALKKIQTISGGNAFVQVDSYHSPEQKKIFESWVLTAMYHDFPDKWLQLFKEAGYTGDYNWTVIG